jgi:hypothetical protein
VISVAVDTSQELGARAASALLGHPSVDRIGVLDRDPPKSWGDRARRVSSAEGFDVGIGVEGARVRVYRREPVGKRSVGWASPVGLVMAAGSRLDAVVVHAVTVPGTPLSDGERFAFPPPIGWARGRHGQAGVIECPVEGRYAGILATGRSGAAIGAADDSLFLAAVCLAAGAVVAGIHPEIDSVWDAPEEYLAACESLGVVLAAT